MKLKEIQFVPGSYATVQGVHEKRLVASDKIGLELDMATLSVCVEDRHHNGSTYNVPLATLRLWVRADDPKPVKKAVGQ